MPPSKGRTTTFQSKHALEYALDATARDLQGAVETVQCLFCVHYGREAREGPHVKRRRTATVMLWTNPFRPEHYRQHHESQHPIAWCDYQSRTLSDRKTFFSTPKKGSLHSFLDLSKDHIVFRIRGPIVEKLIADLFFHPENDEEDEDSEPITKANALKLFQKENDGSYSVTIKNRLRFLLALDHVSVGLSFRQTARVISQHRSRTKNAKLGGLNDHMVGQFVRILVAVNLNALSSILTNPGVWCFSLAADGSTHFGVSFLDIRIRVFLSGNLHNLHLAVMPFFDRHTSSNIFDCISNVLNTLSDSWRDKLISVSSDGENTMTGRHSGVVTRLENAATHRILRIWCVPHQIDLVIKAVTKEIDNGQFYKVAHAFSVHLRAQANLITSMKSKCPKDTTRWLAFGNMLQWLLDQRTRILQHVEEKNPVQSPTPGWWVMAAALCPLYQHCNVLTTKLQSPELVVSQQRVEVGNLVFNLIDNFNIKSTETDNSYLAMQPDEFFVEGLFWIALESVSEHIEDQVGIVVPNMLLID
jgi:hypothetical protein